MFGVWAYFTAVVFTSFSVLSTNMEKQCCFLYFQTPGVDEKSRTFNAVEFDVQVYGLLLRYNVRNQADTENPYKLTIVDSVEPSSDKFYTLSMNGLVCSTKDRTEFVTVEQFERQYM